MKNLLEYRTNDYFNEKDDYLVYSSLNEFFVTQVHLYNGSWYTNAKSHYKLTSVKSINCNELLRKEVSFIETEVVGIVNKRLNVDLGVSWKQGKAIRKYGLPPFWNNPENLTINENTDNG